MPHNRYARAFAIIRIDTFTDLDVPLEDMITVKRIVRSQETAQSEVERLNQLNQAKGARYYWWITRSDRE